MSKMTMPDEKGNQLEKALSTTMKRSSFLKYAGTGVAASALFIAGCKDDDDDNPSATTVALGSDDVGILNYAYALEQLEAAFYIQVITTPFTGITAAETTMLTEIRDHEIIHRDFFKAAIGSAAIPALEVDFSKIDFKSRASVLGTAKAFEDLGVAAYNGAGKLISQSPTGKVYLELAGKIVSVEARHAAAIRDLLNPLSADFAGDDVVSVAAGLDGAKTPSEVLAIAGAYLKTKIDASKLPTT